MKEHSKSLSSLLNLVTSSSTCTSTPKRVGFLACCEFSKKTTVDKIRKLISEQHWQRVGEFCSGDVTSDWVKWFVIEEQDRRGAVLEVLYPYDLYLDDSCHELCKLTSNEFAKASRHIVKWIN